MNTVTGHQVGGEVQKNPLYTVLLNRENSKGTKSPFSTQGYSRKKYLEGEEGKPYIFLWVVGGDIFQIIWVIGVWKKFDYMGGGVLSENQLLTLIGISNWMFLYQSKYWIPICLFFCSVKSSNLCIN